MFILAKWHCVKLPESKADEEHKRINNSTSTDIGCTNILTNKTKQQLSFVLAIAFGNPYNISTAVRCRSQETKIAACGRSSSHRYRPIRIVRLENQSCPFIF